jgi:hypothetical protein
MKRAILWLVICGFVAGLASWVTLSVREANAPITIQPEVVADYIHAVVEATRTVYTTNVVNKMQERGIVVAGEHWKEEATLPLPAQFLLDTGRAVTQKGHGIKYRLASLSPIYVWNAPNTDFERKGLEAVTQDPSQPFTGIFKVGRSKTFQAVYADVAISQACVNCHNGHPNSSRRDWKEGDVMGGLIITIPIEE